MAQAELAVQLRETAGKGVARKLRADELIPAVFYGAGDETVSLTLKPADLRKLILAAPSSNFLLKLKIGDKIEPAMLKDYQVHPLSRRILHADFLRVEANKPLTIEVAIEYTGEPVGMAQGGLFEVKQYFLMVTGLPANLPEKLEADVSGMDIGDQFKLSDLNLPDGITTADDPETVLAAVAMPSMGLGEEGEGGEGEEGEEGEETAEGAEGDEE